MKWPEEEQESWNYGLEKEGSGRREWKGGMARRRSSRNESQYANYRCRPFLSALFLSITPVMNALCSSVLLHHRGGVTQKYNTGKITLPENSVNVLQLL